MLFKIGRVEEVVVTPLFIGIIAVPETSGITVKDGTGVATLLGEDGRRRIGGIITTVVNHVGTVIKTIEGVFHHGLGVRGLPIFYLVKEIREGDRGLGVIEGI